MTSTEMFDCARELHKDFDGCPQETVDTLKKLLLEKLCAPEYRSITTLRLAQTFSMNDDMVVIDLYVLRGEQECVLRVIATDDGDLHTI